MAKPAGQEIVSRCSTFVRLSETDHVAETSIDKAIAIWTHDQMIGFSESPDAVLLVKSRVSGETIAEAVYESLGNVM